MCKVVAGSHRLAAYHNKHCWRVSVGIRINDVEQSWTTKIGVLVIFLQFLVLMHISRVNCTKMAGDRPSHQDNLHVKFSALNADFNSLCFDSFGSRRPSWRGIKIGYPFKMHNFCCYSLIQHENSCRCTQTVIVLLLSVRRWKLSSRLRRKILKLLLLLQLTSPFSTTWYTAPSNILLAICLFIYCIYSVNY